MDVTSALLSRRSVRGFTTEQVPQAVVREVLEAAARAPSGTNMQPWKAYVLAGAKKDMLSAAVLEEVAAKRPLEPEYPYYPPKFREPYLSRRRKVGWDLYGTIGIKKGDTEAMAKQHAKNFTFFDAPVGIIFTIDKDLELGSWLDHGIFLGCFMIAARGKGLHTCPQAAWANHPNAIRCALSIAPTEAVVCGMALGYEDVSAAVNSLRTEREPVEQWAVFEGF